MYKRLLTLTLLTQLLAAGSCAPLGDFCDLAEYMDTDVPELASDIVRLDRPLAERMRVQNLALDRCPSNQPPVGTPTS